MEIAYSIRGCIHDRHIGDTEAGRHGTRAVAESLHLIFSIDWHGILRSQSSSQWHISNNNILPHPSQTVPLTRDQTFKHVRLYGPFSVKPHSNMRHRGHSHSKHESMSAIIYWSIFKNFKNFTNQPNLSINLTFPLVDCHFSFRLRFP